MKNPNTQEAEFCIDCPMRGEIEGSIEVYYANRLHGTISNIFSPSRSVNLGTYAIATDDARNTSEPIRIPNIFDEPKPKKALRRVIRHIQEDIALCEGPDTMPGFFRKSRQYIVGCHALRQLSIEESLPEEILSMTSSDELADELKTKAKLMTYTRNKPDLDGEISAFFNE